MTTIDDTSRSSYVQVSIRKCQSHGLREQVYRRGSPRIGIQFKRLEYSKDLSQCQSSTGRRRHATNLSKVAVWLTNGLSFNDLVADQVLKGDDGVAGRVAVRCYFCHNGFGNLARVKGITASFRQGHHGCRVGWIGHERSCRFGPGTIIFRRGIIQIEKELGSNGITKE